MPEVGACHSKYFTFVVFMFYVGCTLHFKILFNGITLLFIRHRSFFYFPNLASMVLIFHTRLFFHLLKLFKGVAFFAAVHCFYFYTNIQLFYKSNIFAPPNAAPAATAPISITRKAPAQGGMPVIRLLK